MHGAFVGWAAGQAVGPMNNRWPKHAVPINIRQAKRRHPGKGENLPELEGISSGGGLGPPSNLACHFRACV